MKYYGYIYKIVCKVNGKVYIGQTTRLISHRWTSHCYDALNNRGSSDNKFYNAIRLYGKESFKMSLLSFGNNKEELNHREKYYIKLLFVFN